VRIPLDAWAEADPKRTRFLIAHYRRPSSEEQDLRKTDFLWGEEEEAIRQEWLSADAAGDEERAADARRRLFVALDKLGFGKATELSPWDPQRASELRPGIYIQDERPAP
jgi:hypothetical protein